MDLQKMTGIIRFGAFELDRNSGELRKSGLKIHLREQPFRILAMLLERQGEIITREEMQKVLWPNDTVVEFEHSINAAIKALRAVLGDDADNPRFVETLPRRGYRFIAPVDGIVAPVDGIVAPVSPPAIVAAGLSRQVENGGVKPPLQKESGARYRLLEKLGAGGMGEVYKAEDLKIRREVALKFLPEDFTSDPKALERFRREAQLASSLNHPHICSIYDTGELDGRQFISMELVEGETLAKRLAKPLTPGLSPQGRGEKDRDLNSQPSPLGRGWPRRAGTGEGLPLSLDSVLEYGIEIAGALAAAHRLGIIHRDLKPQNIMLTKSGTKLLDFGLAKVVAPVSPPAARKSGDEDIAATATPTAAESLTAQGAIMGTLHYMVPEQLEGKPADARTDIFAFGCVLYEMATGRRAFEGESSAQVMAAIMKNDPALISQLGAIHESPLPPPGLERAIKKCLAKDPDERWQSAADLGDELKWIAEAGSQPGLPAPVVARRKTREWLGWMVAAALTLPLLAALAWTVVHSGRNIGNPGAIRFVVAAPPKVDIVTSIFPVVSPDGKRVVFCGHTQDGISHLWLRTLDSLAAEMLPGTEGASNSFWSPDSGSIIFNANGKLERLDLSGGPPQTLCNAPGQNLSGTWGSGGEVVFSTELATPLYLVSAAGGEAKPLTALDGSPQEISHRWPQFLPDGRHFIYLALSSQRENGGIYGGSLDSKEVKRILSPDHQAAYASPGYLLFMRGNALMAQPFDDRKLQVVGEPSPLGQWLGGFSVSQNGVLAYQSDSVVSTQFVWYDREGKRLGGVGAPADYTNPALSPDGKKLAVGRADPQTGTRDLWVFDLARATSTRLTFDPADDLNPAWSPDGSRVMFTSGRKGYRDIYEKMASGVGSTQSVLESSDQKSVNDWSADGRFVVYGGGSPVTGGAADLWVLPLFGERKPAPFLKTKFSEREAQFSPDGRWIAYTSNESGTDEVYVQSFPGPGGKWQVSTDGGSEPRWRRGGRELFYLWGEKVMAVEVKSSGLTFAAGIPKVLFEAPLDPRTFLRNRYVVTSDGQRFLISTRAGEESSSSFTVVLNWPALLKKQ